MEWENMSGLAIELMKDSGATIKWKALALLSGSMDADMKVTIKMIKCMGKECIKMSITKYLLDLGNKEKNMETRRKLIVKGKKNLANGITAKR